TASPAKAASPGGVGTTADGAVLLRALIAERAELPAETIRPDSRLFRDLHLTSLAVAEIVSTAAARLGLPAPAAPLDFADAAVDDVAAALARMQAVSAAGPPAEAAPRGIAEWVRVFSVVPRAAAPPAMDAGAGAPGTWRLIGDDPPDVAAAVRARVRSWPGAG